MTLLAPWALWFAAVGAAVVALYLLKIRRRQQGVPALEFWLALAGKTRVHSLFQRLKRLLSMLLWLAIAASLVLALGNPIVSLGRVKPCSIAVVIDNSASMQTREPTREGRTRLELAIQALEELTTQRPVADQWLLVEAAAHARVLVPWTYDSKGVRRACEHAAMAPFDGAGDLEGAVELAGQLLAGKPEPRIVVISDGGAGAVAKLAQKDSRVVPWVIGETRNNAGIVALSVRAHRQQSNYHALIRVLNDSDQRLDTALTLEIDGRTHSVEMVGADPRGTWEKTVVIDAPMGDGAAAGAGHVLRASLDHPDSLALDNDAYAVLEPIRPAVVWLVSDPEQAFFFEQALGAMEPLVLPEECLTLSPGQYEQAIVATNSAAAPDSGAERTLRAPDLVVFNDTIPVRLPACGRMVFVNGWPEAIAPAPSGEIERPQLLLNPRPHPLTQHVNLPAIHLARAQRVAATPIASVLAQSADGDPLVFMVERDGRQSLCVAFDVLQSDMPFRNAFPLLLRNAVAYMHSDAPAWTPSSRRIGEPVRSLRPLPAGVTTVSVGVVEAGRSEEQSLPVVDREFVFTKTSHAGALRFTMGDEACYTAVNIGDDGESRITPMAASDDPRVTLALSRGLLGVAPWVALAGFACVLVTLEWLTFNQRWTE